jgi:short-subunit dehydrogenase
MRDKVVVITGGSSGIGLALAEKFGIEGSKVVITGRNSENLKVAQEKLIAKSIEVLAVQADTVSFQDNQDLLSKVMEHYGRVDVIIANAGISMRAYFEDVQISVLERVMDVNFFGAVRFISTFLPQIIQNKGTVIGISSVAGYRGLPGRTGYCASKFALNGFLESLRTEMLEKNVTVMTVCPGYVASNIRATALLADGTPQNHSPRNEDKMMSAERCAHIIYQAFLKEKKVLILSFKDKITIFLSKLFPVFMDEIVLNSLSQEEGSIVSKTTKK